MLILESPSPRLLALRGLPYFLDRRDLIDSTLLIVGRPLANLNGILEVVRAQPGAILSEPLPVTAEPSVAHLSFGPNAAVFIDGARKAALMIFF